MKQPFKPFTIAVTGDFGEARTHDKIKQWIEANGGNFTLKISAEATHLVCSREHYKKQVAMGTFAIIISRLQYSSLFDCQSNKPARSRA